MKKFINATMLAEEWDISRAKAYTIIRDLNQELAKSGYIVIPGKVSRDFYESKMYLKNVDHDASVQG